MKCRHYDLYEYRKFVHLPLLRNHELCIVVNMRNCDLYECHEFVHLLVSRKRRINSLDQFLNIACAVNVANPYFCGIQELLNCIVG